MLKLRDPNTGAIFENIEKACNWYCSWRSCDRDCNIYRQSRDCITYCREHPIEAAELMGFVAFDDGTVFFPVWSKTEKQEDNMDKKDKPLSEWTLQDMKSYCCERGSCKAPTKCAFYGDNGLCTFRGVTPNLWDLSIDINRRSLTEAERERCRAFGAKYVSRDGGYDRTNWVEIWDEKPEETEIEGEKIFAIGENSAPIARASAKFFPSVKPGELIGVEETKT